MPSNHKVLFYGVAPTSSYSPRKILHHVGILILTAVKHCFKCSEMMIILFVLKVVDLPAVISMQYQMFIIICGWLVDDNIGNKRMPKSFETCE